MIFQGLVLRFLELLQDKRFVSAAADVVRSVSADGDMCTFLAPTEDSATIKPNESRGIVALASVEKENTADGEYFEILRGRISRVDLDAIKRHLGFKVGDQGSTVDATFDERPSEEEMKSLLGEWVEMKGMVKYVGGQRNHIGIQEFSVIKQQKIDFE